MNDVLSVYTGKTLHLFYLCTFCLGHLWAGLKLGDFKWKTHLLIMVPVIATTCRFMIMFGKIWNRMKPLASQFGWKISIDGSKITLYTDYQKKDEMWPIISVYIWHFSFSRNIMMDVRRDNRVLSLVSKAGLRNLLTTMLDQLQRCQKSLNEFLEVWI